MVFNHRTWSTCLSKHRLFEAQRIGLVDFVGDVETVGSPVTADGQDGKAKHWWIHQLMVMLISESPLIKVINGFNQQMIDKDLCHFGNIIRFGVDQCQCRSSFRVIRSLSHLLGWDSSTIMAFGLHSAVSLRSCPGSSSRTASPKSGRWVLHPSLVGLDMMCQDWFCKSGSVPFLRGPSTIINQASEPWSCFWRCQLQRWPMSCTALTVRKPGKESDCPVWQATGQWGIGLSHGWKCRCLEALVKVVGRLWLVPADLLPNLNTGHRFYMILPCWSK